MIRRGHINLNSGITSFACGKKPAEVFDSLRAVN
jgi:hypothetical protein